MQPRAYGDSPPAPLDRLNDGWPNGPRSLVLLGPPGTGKTTTVLSTWLLPALADGVLPAEILSCSFTRSAAGELRDRLAKKLGVDPDELRQTCSTVHAEAYRRVRERFGESRFKLGVGVKAKALDDSEDVDGPAQRVTEIDFSSEGEQLARSVWDLARNMLALDLDSAAFAAIATKKAPQMPLGEVRLLIRKYEAAKEADNRLDFTDLLLRALECEPPERRILVLDEAQDSTPLQWALIEKWRAAAEFTVLVGDFDQTIHEWAGASPAKLYELLEGGFDVRRLERSFRVPRATHALATSLIRRNRSRIDAPYEAADRAGLAQHATTIEAMNLIEDYAAAGREVFVLARSAAILSLWPDELAARGVAFDNERGWAPLGAPSGVAAARALAAFLEDRPAAREDVKKLVAGLAGRPKGRFFTGTKKASLVGIGTLQREVTPGDLATVGVKLDELLVGEYEAGLLAAGLEDRAHSIALLVKRHTSAVLDKKPPVTLTTMHASKGREADLVVVDLTAPYPTQKAVQSGDAKVVEGERRLLYVALTRAKHELLVVHPQGRDLGSLLGLNGTEVFGSW